MVSIFFQDVASPFLQTILYRVHVLMMSSKPSIVFFSLLDGIDIGIPRNATERLGFLSPSLVPLLSERFFQRDYQFFSTAPLTLPPGPGDVPWRRPITVIAIFDIPYKGMRFVALFWPPKTAFFSFPEVQSGQLSRGGSPFFTPYIAHRRIKASSSVSLWTPRPSFLSLSASSRRAFWREPRLN